jgi:hypothetical protein
VFILIPAAGFLLTLAPAAGACHYAKGVVIAVIESKSCATKCTGKIFSKR